MRTLRAAALLLLSLGLALGASACGNSSSGGAGSGAAVYAPASTAVFVTVDTDTEGDQWQALDALLAKFPDGEGAIDKALSELGGEEGLDFETDIRPAVGDEIAVVVLDAKSDDAVVLTQPADPDKLKQLAATGDGAAGVTEQLEDGWWAAAQSQEALDAFNEARDSGDSLADEDAYQDATEDLFEDGIATLYVNGRLAAQAGDTPDELSQAQTALAKCFGGDDASEASFALAARIEDGGVRVAGDAASSVIPVGDDGGGDLDQFFRADALAYVSTSGIGDAIRKIADCVASNDSTAAQTLAQIQLGLGVSLDDDVAGLFDGSTGVAVYAPPSDTSYVSFEPDIVLATEVDDEDAAMQLIQDIVTRAGGLMGMMGGESSISIEDTSIDGMDQAKVLSSSGNPVLYIGARDGKLVASNSEAALAALNGGSSLADDPEYSAGREAAGVSDDAAAVVYVNIGNATGLIPGALGAGGWSAYGPETEDATANLEPLKSLFFWSEQPDDGSVSFEGFLQVE